MYINRNHDLGYISASIDHYKLWSSRLIVEGFLMLFTKFYILGRILNALVMLLTVIMLCKYGLFTINSRNLLLSFAIYCLIPLALIGETGLMATSMNYHWPVAFALFSFFPFYQTMKNEKINLKIYLISIPFLLFAANQEQINICFFTLTSIISVYLLKYKNYNLKLILLSIISLGELVFFATAPGNKVRYFSEINRWFPEFEKFTFINKLDLAISSFGRPFFLDSNFLFFLLFLLISTLTILTSKNYLTKIIISIPLFVNLILFVGSNMSMGFINQLWRDINLEKTFTTSGTQLQLHAPRTWLPTLIILFLTLCLIIGILSSFKDKRISILMVLLFLMSICSRMLLGFSPTVWASSVRTYYLLFVISGLLILRLTKELHGYISINSMEYISITLTGVGLSTFIISILKIIY